MKTPQITLSLLAIGLAVMAGCREETTRTDSYPHLATEYEDPDAVWSEGTEDYEVPDTVEGGWFNAGGDAPGIYLECTIDGTDFDFDNPYRFTDHGTAYYLDYYTEGDLVSDGVSAGSSISWTAQDYIDECQFTGTFSGDTLSGTFNYEWYTTEFTQDVEMVRVQSLFGTAAEQDINTEVTYTLSADQHYQVVKLTINEPTVGVQASTIGLGIDTWLWLFDSEGNYLKNNDEVYVGNNVDSRIENLLNQNDYYFIITQFGNETTEVNFKIVELQVESDS